MKAATGVVVTALLIQLLPAAGFANDTRDPRSMHGNERGDRTQGGSGGSQGGSSGGSGSSSGSSGHGSGSWTPSHPDSGRHWDRDSRHRSQGSWQFGVGWGGWSGWGGWWGWDPYWRGYWYGGPGYGYGYGPRWGYPAVFPDSTMSLGALDTDVSPERAEIWVDGRRVGVADDYDGFPDYLWLPKGTYDVVIYLPGYKTIARQYSIYPGLVIDVEDRMEQGESIHPNDLGPTSHVNRDERLRRDRETREEAEQRYGQPAEPPAGQPSGDDQNWSPGSSRDESLDARGEPAKLRLSIEPDDASVYLDGRFLGTGRDLSRLRSGLLIDPGAHTLEVVRPGYVPTKKAIDISSGSDQDVEIELEEGG